MRVALLTAGSRGDIAPYTGLGHALARAGHRVTVATHACFGDHVTAAGLRLHPLPVDPKSELESARGLGLHRSSTGAGKLARMIVLARIAVRRMAAGLVEAAEDADVLLLSSSLGPLGHAIAEGLGLPSMGVYLQPLAATSRFAPPVTGARSLGPAGNRLAGRAVNAAVDAVYGETVRAVRARFGPPRAGARSVRRLRERQDWPIHHGFSPLVLRRPVDWRPGLTVAGYWWPYRSPDAALPPGLRDFLGAGTPPVFVGFGSVAAPDPRRLGQLVVRALRAAGVRGVVQRGWSGLHAAGDDMYTVDEVDHALLFPHTAAVVHHAGAGTTAAALRAGVPSVPVPVQFDAAFWAHRVAALGTCPRPVPFRALTADRLAAAVRAAVGDPGHARSARAVAARLAAEDGTAPVVRAVDGLAG